tara:strand:+ start:1122 stop:1391 length:270 start_codon:yes stop_codon:yes gene_type:complete
MPPKLTKEQIEKIIHRSACFQRTFSGPDGEEALKEIDFLTMYKNNTFDPDPYQHAYNSGQRSVTVWIHECMDHDVEKAQKLLKERTNES